MRPTATPKYGIEAEQCLLEGSKWIESEPRRVWTDTAHHVRIVGPSGARRSLHAFEHERLRGFGSGYTDAIKKDGATREEHQHRRIALLEGMAAPVVWKFLLGAVIGRSEPDVVDSMEDLFNELDLASRDAWTQAREQCPFNIFRAKQGLQCRNVPPDSAELHGHSSNFLVERRQSRKSVGARLHVRAVPTGLSPEEHFWAALQVDSPMEKDPEVPMDIEFAIEMELQLGAGIKIWRKQQLALLDKLIGKCIDRAQRLDEQRMPNARLCAAAVKVEALELLAYSIGWPDHLLPSLFTTGAKPLGHQDVFGIFRQKQTRALFDEEKLFMNTQVCWHRMRPRSALRQTRRQRSSNAHWKNRIWVS